MEVLGAENCMGGRSKEKRVKMESKMREGSALLWPKYAREEMGI